MKLITLKCPNCGSELQVNGELTKATCNFCGATILIDDEVNKVKFVDTKEAGYEFEKGRQQAQLESDPEYMKRKRELDAYERYEASLTPEQKAKLERNRKIAKYVFYGLLGVGVIALLFVIVVANLAE